MAPSRIVELLENAASSHESKGLAFLEKGLSEAPNELSYPQLLQQAKTNAALLLQSNVVKPGAITIIYFDNHRDNVIWFWSAIEAGGVCAILNPVSNEPKTAADQLGNIKNLFGSTPVLTRHKLSAIFAAKELNVHSVEQLGTRQSGSNGELNRKSFRYPQDGNIAVILFTSGSTGHSKAVQFSHRQLIASVEAKVDHLQTHGKVFMNWTSFDHSASFCEVHLQALLIGSDQVFVPASDLMIEPYRFLHVLSQYRVGYTFAPNFFLAAAVRSLQEQDPASLANLDLSHLAVIMCGGEANRTTTLNNADQVLRQYGASPCSIKAAYGLSETCSACYYNLDTPSYDVENGNAFASVGNHLPGVLEAKIVNNGDSTEEPEQGLVYLRGELIFKGYYNNEEATSSCMTSDGWMNTGDYGKIDEQGNLHLLGRAKEVLILNGQNYSSFEIEHAVESSGIEGMSPSYTAVFSSWSDENNSEAIVVLFNPTEAAIGPKNMRATIQAIEKSIFTVCAQKPRHIVPLPKSLMPKSTIGKLSRAKLKQRFESGAFSDYIVDEKPSTASATSGLPRVDSASAIDVVDSLPPLQREIAQIFSSVVGVPAADLLQQDGLLASGINSMGFMKLKKALEKGLKIHQEIPMPLLVRSHSIADLEHELVLLGTVSHNYDPIVPLATEGSKQPLFLLHPGAGEFLCWVGLLKYLPDRPLYALRAKGLHPGEGTFNDLPELLDNYYNAIKRTQPEGPYAFLGYCFGGLLSFELSKKFEAAGEKVIFSGGIDNPPSLKSTIGQVRYRSLMIDVLPVVTELTEDEARSFAEETADLTDEEFYALLFTKFSPEFIDNMDITIPRLQAFGRVEDSMRLIASSYEPEGSVGTTDIFCADPMPHFGATPEVWKRDVLGEWRSFVKDENVSFHEVQGTHISLIKEPCIFDFQRVLNEALEARGI